MTEFQINPEALRAASSRLEARAADLVTTGTTCVAVDAGEWTGQVQALIRAVTTAGHELASGLAGGAGALQAAANGAVSLDQGVGAVFDTGTLGQLGRP